MGGRRQAAISTVDVNGVPSADSGRHSTIPDAVAAPWDMQRGTRQARHCSRYYSADTDQPDPPLAGEGVRRHHASFREGHSAHTDGVQDLPLEESRTSTCPPDLLVCTPALRPGGPGPPRAPLPLPLLLVHAGPWPTGPTERHRAVYRRPYTSDDHASCRGWQYDRHNLRRTKDDI